MKKICIYILLLLCPFFSVAASGQPSQTTGSIIATSSENIFNHPHGTMRVGNSIMIGTVHTNPGEIIYFPDIHNLNQYASTTTPGFTNLASVDYDSQHDKYYFVSSRIDDNHLEILSVDARTLAWQPVYEFPLVSDVGFSTINTDGKYVYVATQSHLPYIFKVDISNWSLILSKSFPLAFGGFHSAAFHTYSTRSEWYIDTFSSPSQFYKVNPVTLDAVSINLPQSFAITDDVYFRPLNDLGGILYVVSERGGGLDAINTATLMDRHVSSPSSFGLYSDGANLFVLDSFTNAITEYKNFKLSNPMVINIPFSEPANEGFPGPSLTTGFFTTFATSSALYEFSYPGS